MEDLTGADTSQDEDPYVTPAALPPTPGAALPSAPPELAPAPAAVAPQIPVQSPAVAKLAAPVLPPGAARAGTTVTTHVPSPDATATAAKLADNAESEKATARQAAGIEGQKAGIESAGADEQARQHAEFQRLRTQAVDEAEKELAAKRQAHQKAFDDYTAHTDIKDYWADKSTLSKVLAGIATFLGGLGASATGGRNSGAEIIDAAVKQDFDAQRARIERRRSIVEMAKGNVAEAEQAKSDALRALDVKEAAANAAIATRMKAEALKLGVPMAQVNGDKSVQAIEERTLNARQRVDEQDRTTVTQTAAAKVAKAAGGGGGAGAGSGAAQTELAEMAQQGATQAAIVKRAFELGMRDTKHQKVVDVVQKLWNGAQKGAALETRDENGNVIGLASNARAATKAGEQTAAANAYKNALLSYKADLAGGVNLNPLGDAWKRRQALHDEVVARARKAMELGVSAAQQALDTGMIGGTGNAGRMSSPEVIQRLADEVDKTTQTRLNTTLRRGQQVTEQREPAPPSPRAPPAAAAPPKLSTQDRATLLLQLKRHPNDARTGAIKAALGM